MEVNGIKVSGIKTNKKEPVKNTTCKLHHCQELDNNSSVVGNNKCPKCGGSYYQELYTTSTSMYCPTVYKDGLYVTTDMNRTNKYCYCLICNTEFCIEG